MSTVPLQSPKFRAFDANGDPLSGGKLYSYAAGTSTPLDTFTTRAGDIANSNPVILDANGEADVWTTPGLLYKFVLKNSLDVIQWTVDNVPSSGSGGGSSSADTAGAAEPGGRLSLSTGTPVTTADVNGASTIFYVPYKHNMVPLYDGSTWSLHEITTELSQAFSDTTKSPAAAVADTIYDMFVWDDAGTLRVSRGPNWGAWTARGTGAGTTEIEQLNGRWVNANAISNGPAAQRGLYVGSFRVTNLTVTHDIMSHRFLWNAYNRVRRPLRVQDATDSWTYTSLTFRQANGNSANQVEMCLGLSEDPVFAQVLGQCANSTGGVEMAVGIGLDGITLYTLAHVITATPAANIPGDPVANVDLFPGIGAHTLSWLERSAATGTTTWYGDRDLQCTGISGFVMA